MRYITDPPWRVAASLDLDPRERTCVGRIVIVGPPRNATLIADCRSDSLPLEEQRANAGLCARAPRMAQALIELEDKLGDLPAGKLTEQIYRIVANALRDIGVTRRQDLEE